LNKVQYEFPEPVGTVKAYKTILNKNEFKDDGIELSPRAKEIKAAGPKIKGNLVLDPLCLSCTNMQSDIIK